METVAAEARRQRVHNLSVADARTFLVGDGGAWVHNCYGDGSGFFTYGNKIGPQIGPRGWTDQSILDVINNPYTTRRSYYKGTGERATACYLKDGSYVVRNNNTGELIQISDRNDPNWFPDSAIENPYRPR